ncbi:hypothetical protein JJL56_32515 [Azospirillum sp. YIM DDC1]|uniref:LamG domain-containing protein n=1 Tax=Azospirillum aestuarii TaxID=2802052 RepID=A0ABS1I999_9PROT|nr:hypothetical protein [Azospirillum aestuarii]MBK4723566.1 hypothetical protein [Azospirillum aestuarii]
MGLHIVSLTGDWCERYDNSGRRRRLGTFAQRNTVLAEGGITASAALPATGINCVHAAVLPGAQLDAAGMPIPTVVAATAGGTAVLHPGGQVVAVTRAQGHSGALLEADGTLTLAPSGNVVIEEGPVPYTPILNSSWRTWLYDTTTSPATLPGADKVLVPGARGTSWGLELVARDPGNPGAGMVAHVKIASATGWMPGDTRLAALCDAATGAITGSGDLATNGGFDSDTVWSKGTGWSIAGGVATKTPGTGSALSQVMPLTAGVLYAITFTVAGLSAGSATPTISGNGQTVGAAVSANGTYTQYLVAPASPSTVDLYGSGSFSGSLDNVSVRLAVADRSYKGKGLIPNGTLQRTPVAGSDVVAWSGFTPAAYLLQPPNPDLDFPGDCFVGCWVNNTSSWNVLFERSAATGAWWRCDNIGSAGGPSTDQIARFYIGDGTNSAGVVLPVTLRGLGWTQLWFVRRGSTLEAWVNGALVATGSAASVGSLANATATLTIGNARSLGANANSSVSMFRAGAGSPAAAQLRRMYEDEKPWFSDNGKAMLGGISNAVTSLSRDPLTGRLAVGTGDGVSVFQGLRRVSYLDETVLGATTSDTVRSVSLRGGSLLISTAAEVGFVGDAIGGKEAIAVGGPRPVGNGFTARGVTTDGMALDLESRSASGKPS